MNSPSNPFDETICGTCEPEDELDAAIHTPLPVDDDDDEVTCAICLSSPPEEERRRLEGCTHQFCTLCLSKLVVHALTPINKSPTLGNAAVAACMKACRCPSCATRLSEAEIDRCLVDARGTVPCRLPALRSALRRASAALAEEVANGNNNTTNEPPRPPPPENPQAQRAFEAWARRLHIKYCPGPGCGAPIEKNGGCPNMRCGSCGHNFRWDRVPLACPCRGFHTTKGYPFFTRCNHMRRGDMRPLRRAEFEVKRSVVLAPAVLIVAPILLVAVPIYCVAGVVRDEMRHRKQRSLRRARERRQRDLAQSSLAELEAELGRVTACRRTGEHAWVSGWCQNCGIIDPSQSNPTTRVMTPRERALMETGARPGTSYVEDVDELLDEGFEENGSEEEAQNLDAELERRLRRLHERWGGGGERPIDEELESAFTELDLWGGGGGGEQPPPPLRRLRS